MANVYDIIIRPIITERSMADVANKKYVFEVAKNAGKVEIKNAVEAAAENAKQNGVGESFEGLFGNVLTSVEFEKRLGGDYDLICANIMADVHIAMKSIHFDKLKPGGTLILSGIIENRADELRKIFESSGFEYTGTAEENGWLALGFIKTELVN